jgi:Leucine-rich repeat (LRR) protein
MTTIAWIPASLQNLGHLVSLTLSNLQLTTLPLPVTHLPALKRLDVSRNAIDNLEAFGFVASDFPRRLECLNLGHNALSGFSLKPLQSFACLRLLLLSNNRIMMIPKVVGRLLSLEYLCLNYNQIETVPNTVIAHINKVSLLGNPLHAQGHNHIGLGSKDNSTDVSATRIEGDGVAHHADFSFKR